MIRLAALLLLLAPACDVLEGGTDVTARQWDDDGACWGASEVVGTTTADGCDDALTLGTGPSGECWLFNDSCLPDEEGWAPGCPVSFAEVDGPMCE